jgi:hypothetical protein
VLCGARADVTDFSYMTLMDTSVVKHNMLKVFVIQMKERLEIRDILLKYVSCCFMPL